MLGAAADLFAHQGVDGVSLRQIAAAADVQLALIGRYVGTRDELVQAVYDDLSEQVAHELTERPLDQLSFEVDSAMGRWTRMLMHLVVTGGGAELLTRFNPVLALSQVLHEQYGVDEVSARVRSAQIAASALGWRTFEDYLVKAVGLDAIERAALRDDLHHTHQWLGSTPYPARLGPPARRTGSRKR